jgi:2-isopropylmalate synthase
MSNKKETNSWNAEKYRKHAGFVSDLALPVVELLNPKEGEKILDLGCGDGVLGLEIAKYGTEVVGIDASENMVVKAKENGLNAKLISVTDMPFEQEFDAVFSNAMLHWVKEPRLAVENIAKALKRGGRFVAEFGGDGDIVNIERAMREVFARHPEYGEIDDFWFFPTTDEYKSILEEYGFEVRYIELIPRPTPIDDIANWLMLFTNGFTKSLTHEEQIQFREEVREILKSTNYSEKDGWVADYVRIRVEAYKRDKVKYQG